MATRDSLVKRLWLSIPEPAFRSAGVIFFLWLCIRQIGDYRHFLTLGPYYRFSDGRMLYMPWIRVLSDWTGILVVLGFAFRKPARQRNARASDIAIGLLGSYWLFIPFLILAGCDLADRVGGSRFAPAFQHYWIASSLTLSRTLIGAALLTIGNALDTWGYTVLMRSFSLVPEARELRVSGPYRFLRHPVYFGQILAQAGFYLCFAGPHLVWPLFWAGFCAIQLRRAWREEKVLEAAFGDTYREWKARTLWFWSGRGVAACEFQATGSQAAKC